MTTATMLTGKQGLDACEREIRPLWEQREKLEKQISALPQQNTLLDENARALKRKLAAGDSSASAKLDAIDRERRENARLEEGLRADLAELDERIEPIKRRMAECRRTITEAQNQREFEEWSAELDRLRLLFLDKYFAGAAQTLAEIQLSGDRGVRRWNNKALRVFEDKIMTPLSNPSHVLAQRGWHGPHTDYWRRQFTLFSLMPNGNGNGNGKPR